MKRIQSIALFALLAGAASFTLVGCKTHDDMDMHGSNASASAGSYPLKTCVVSGEDLGDKPYTFTHNGQTVKLCCKDCLAKFDKDPDKYMAKLNEAK
jgi:YHS domain-containing protein